MTKRTRRKVNNAGLITQKRMGRPPKDEASRKSEPFSIRLTKGIRERLDAARLKINPERSLGQEIELRIIESFGRRPPSERAIALASAVMRACEMAAGTVACNGGGVTSAVREIFQLTGLPDDPAAAIQAVLRPAHDGKS